MKVEVEKNSIESGGNSTLRFWWEREDLSYIGDTLHFKQQSIPTLSQKIDTPFYVYNKDRVLANITRLHTALKVKNISHRMHYAMKANRHPVLLKEIYQQGIAGVDVCSPNELELAIQIGFKEEQINYTGTSISNRDYESIALYPNFHFNADSLSVIRQIGERKLFKKIGIRVQPNIGLGYNQSLEYAGQTVKKFGLTFDQIEEAFHLAKNYGIEIDTLHFHAGSGYLTAQLSSLKVILESIRPILDEYSIQNLNIGGGLGVPQKEGDEPLDLDQWSTIIRDFQLSRPNFQLILEPGDYLVKDAGLLIAEVCYVEEKGGQNFIGLNVGINVNYEYAYYQMNLEAIPVQTSKAKLQKYTIAGNINEPIDLMGENVVLPSMKEGDLIALYNTGGYGASTASNHCMRGDFEEMVI